MGMRKYTQNIVREAVPTLRYCCQIWTNKEISELCRVQRSCVSKGEDKISMVLHLKRKSWVKVLSDIQIVTNTLCLNAP